MNNDELLYCTEPSSILVKDVTNSDVRDMILRLKHSAGKLGLLLLSFTNYIGSSIALTKREFYTQKLAY